MSGTSLRVRIIAVLILLGGMCGFGVALVCRTFYE